MDYGPIVALFLERLKVFVRGLKAFLDDFEVFSKNLETTFYFPEKLKSTRERLGLANSDLTYQPDAYPTFNK